MRKKMAVIILIGVFMLAMCSCGREEEIKEYGLTVKDMAEGNSSEENKSKENKSEENKSEEDMAEESTSAENIPDGNIPETERQAEAAGEGADSFSFSDVKDLQFCFASGAGGWMTALTIKEDGSFSGEFFDGELGLTGEGYPNGTMYDCIFSGQFTQPKKVNDYTYSMRISELNYAEEVGKEEIKDGMLYIYIDVYGLDGAEDILIYLPGAPLDKLPEEFRGWIGYYNLSNTTDTELPFYALNNEAQQYGFYSHILQESSEENDYQEPDKGFDISAELQNAENQAAQLEQILNDAITQLDMNDASKKLYELWDKELNIIWNKLKETLSEEEMAKLVIEEREWIEYKEAEAEAAGSEYEGGSMQPMVTALKKAELTKERVYVLAGYLGEI